MYSYTTWKCAPGELFIDHFLPFKQLAPLSAKRLDPFVHAKGLRFFNSQREATHIHHQTCIDVLCQHTEARDERPNVGILHSAEYDGVRQSCHTRPQFNGAVHEVRSQEDILIAEASVVG